jgi:hypothetical protein
MALVVEDGTVVPNADALVSRAFVDAYNVNYVNSSTWVALSDDAKDRAIRQGTQFVVSRYEGRWKGYIVDFDQTMPWPRYYCTDAEGLTVQQGTIPLKVMQAVAEISIKAAGTTLFDDQTITGSLTLERKKVGPLEIEKRWNGASVAKVFPIVDKLVSGYLVSTPGGYVVPVERA